MTSTLITPKLKNVLKPGKSWNFSLTISRTFQAFKTGISTPLLPVPSPPSSLPFCLWLLSSFKYIMYGFDIILVCRKFQYLMIFKGISWGNLFLFFFYYQDISYEEAFASLLI